MNLIRPAAPKPATPKPAPVREFLEAHHFMPAEKQHPATTLVYDLDYPVMTPRERAAMRTFIEREMVERKVIRKKELSGLFRPAMGAALELWDRTDSGTSRGITSFAMCYANMRKSRQFILHNTSGQVRLTFWAFNKW
jgi:hypothetical protein